jgi:exopolysaccharide production protein ExoZ
MGLGLCFSKKVETIHYFSGKLKKEKEYLNHIESLRAIAALMVLVFHFLSFSGVDGFIMDNTAIRNYSKFGAQGVELFYIISGFVIYYSLTKINLTISQYPKYLAKRFSRIFPPFLATLVLICLVALIWKGTYPYSFNQIIQNATLSIDLFKNSEWMNPIFVTLKVEFLFYLVIGLLVVFMQRNKLLYSVIIVLSLISVFFFHSTDFIHNVPFFVIGIVCSQVYKTHDVLLNYILLGAVLLLLGVLYPIEDVVVSVVTIVFLLWIKIQNTWLEKMGRFSYSIYLTHGLTGGLFFYLFKNSKYLDLNVWVAFILAILVALICSYLFYLLVEKRAIKWSKNIHY